MLKIFLEQMSLSPKKETIDYPENKSPNASFLYVYNDSFNTFDHVIETLIRICGHTEEQAHQCTLLIHFKGKCSVKKGIKKDLLPMKEAIISAGIKASIV